MALATVVCPVLKSRSLNNLVPKKGKLRSYFRIFDVENHRVMNVFEKIFETNLAFVVKFV